MTKAAQKARSASSASSITSEDPSTPQQDSSHKKSKSTRTPLSENQKNTNHKDAENKRRNAIREQFTQLSQLVPGAEGLERSEYVMLGKTITYLQEQTEEARRLEHEIIALGGSVAEEYRMRDDEWGGPDWKPKNIEDYDRLKARKSVHTAPGSAHTGRRFSGRANGTGDDSD